MDNEQRKIYRHHKGGLYEIVCEAKYERNGFPAIVYKSVETGEIWVRPRFEFKEKFTLEKS